MRRSAKIAARLTASQQGHPLCRRLGSGLVFSPHRRDRQGEIERVDDVGKRRHDAGHINQLHRCPTADVAGDRFEIVVSPQVDSSLRQKAITASRTDLDHVRPRPRRADADAGCKHVAPAGRRSACLMRRETDRNAAAKSCPIHLRSVSFQ